MTKYISVRVSPSWRFRIAVIWLSFWLILSFILSFVFDPPHNRVLLGLFVGVGAMGAYVINAFIDMKPLFQNVIFDNGHFFIQGDSSKIFPLSISDIDGIKEYNYLWFRFFEINLKKDTSIGRTIRFRPARHAFPKGCNLLEVLKHLENSN